MNNRISMIDQNTSQLLGLIANIKEEITANPDKEQNPVVQIIECYLLCIIVMGGHDLLVQNLLWKKFITDYPLLSWEAGFNYIIDEFFKKPHDIKNYEMVLSAYAAITSKLDILNFDPISEEAKQQRELFIKKINIYKSITFKSIKTKQVDNIGMTFKMNLNTLENIETMDLDDEAIKAIQAIPYAEIQNYNTNLGKHHDPFSHTLDITLLLMSAIVIRFHTRANISMMNPDYIKNVLYEFRNSQIHINRHNAKKMNLNKEGLLQFAYDCFMKVFVKPFPLVEIAIASHIVDEIKACFNEAFDVSQDNVVLIKMTKSITATLDIFSQRYGDIYNQSKDCMEKTLAVTTEKEELTKMIKVLENYVKNRIPKECTYILKSFHERMALIHVRFLRENKTDTKNDKSKIIECYRQVKHLYPTHFLPINLLYEVKVNIHEIDEELHAIYKKILKSIDSVASKKRSIDFCILFYSNIESYMQCAMYNMLRIDMEDYTYDKSKTLNENIENILKKTFVSLMKRDALEAISFCQMMEQLLTSHELRSRVLDIYNLMEFEIVNTKLGLYSRLIALSKTTEKVKIDFNLIAHRNMHYVESVASLRDNPHFQIIEDTNFVEILLELIQHLKTIGNMPEARRYLDMGHILLPDETAILREMIAIESMRVKNIILKLDISMIKENLNLYKKRLEDRVNIHAPTLIKNNSKHASVIVHYNHLVSEHAELVRRHKLIMKYENEAKSIIAQYENIIFNLEKFMHLDTSEFSVSEIGALKDLLNTIHATLSDCEAFCDYLDKLDTAEIAVTNCIKDYTVGRLNFNEMERSFEQICFIANENAEKNATAKAIAKSKRIADMKAKADARKLNKLAAQMQKEQQKEQATVDVNDESKMAQENSECNDNQRIDVENNNNDGEVIAEYIVNDDIQPNDTISVQMQQPEEVIEVIASIQPILPMQAEEDFLRDNIIFYGAGKPISANVIDTLNNFDQALQKIGSGLVFTGSLIARIGIFYFNQEPACPYPDVAAKFTVNDLDMKISYDESVNFPDLIYVIESFGFKSSVEPHAYFEQPQIKFKHHLDGIGIDLTLVLPALKTFDASDFVILRMGSVKFVTFMNEDEISKAVAEKRMILPGYTHFFEILLPPGHENNYVSDCKLQSFSILPPDTKFKLMGYGAYKYALKVDACKSMDTFNRQAISSSTSVFFHELRPLYIKYFEEQFESKHPLYYRELNEFIIKGIIINTEHLATPFISSFFHVLIKNKMIDLKIELTDHAILSKAEDCAAMFIDKYTIHKNDKINMPFDLKKAIDNIVESEMQYYKAHLPVSQNTPSQYAYPGMLFPQQRPAENFYQPQESQGNHMRNRYRRAKK